MNQPTSINILHIASGDLWAGAEMQLYTLAVALNRRAGIRVQLILFNHGELEQRLRHSSIPVTVLDEQTHSPVALLRHLIRCVRDIRPDIIHTHRKKENILGSIAGLFCGAPRQVRSVHGAPEFSSHWWQARQSLWRLLDWASGRFLQHRIIAVSEELRHALEKKFPVSKIVHVSNGIDAGTLAATHPDTADLPPGITRIGIVGRLVPVKRIDLFLEIVKCIGEARPDGQFSFHILGDGPLRQELEALNHTLCADRASFEGHRSDIHGWIQLLDVLVICSDHEGLPMTLLEAMALGTAVVSHAVGEIPRVLENGRCGILVRSQEPADYARAIIDLSERPGFAADITDLARRRVAEVYSADSNAEQISRVYNELLAHT